VIDRQLGGETLADPDSLGSFCDQFDSLYPLFMIGFVGSRIVPFFPICRPLSYRRHVNKTPQKG
jgi:hypothetical protein